MTTIEPLSLEELAQMRGEVFLTLLLPPRSDMWKVKEILGDEYICSKHEKEFTAVFKMLQHIKTIMDDEGNLIHLNRIPAKGLVLLCDGEEVYERIPIKEIKECKYFEDNRFHLEEAM